MSYEGFVAFVKARRRFRSRQFTLVLTSQRLYLRETTRDGVVRRYYHQRVEDAVRIAQATGVSVLRVDTEEKSA